MAILRKVNELFIAIVKKTKMMTCITGVLDVTKGIVTFTNAGQSFPYLLSSNGTVAEVEATSQPLGVSKKDRFFAGEIDLRGKTLFLYSDCLVESNNEQEEPVGYEGLQKYLSKLARAQNAWGPDELFAMVHRFTGTVPWGDDAAVVVVLARQDETSAPKTPGLP